MIVTIHVMVTTMMIMIMMVIIVIMVMIMSLMMPTKDSTTCIKSTVLHYERKLI